MCVNIYVKYVPGGGGRGLQSLLWNFYLYCAIIGVRKNNHIFYVKTISFWSAQTMLERISGGTGLKLKMMQLFLQ